MEQQQIRTKIILFALLRIYRRFTNIKLTIYFQHMKTLLLILFAINICTATKAQSPDKVLARVKYNFTHVRDTNQTKNPYTENMLLVIGKNASIFTSLTSIERDLNLPKAKRV